MAPRRNRRLNLRLSDAEFAGINAYADRHGTSVSELLRAHIHQLISPHSQPPLPGTQIVPLDGGKRSKRKCAGRLSEPEYDCPNDAFQDFDKCRGCAIADQGIDAMVREEEKLRGKRIAGRSRY